MSHYFQGKFKPKNPKKYKGNVKEIVYRSGWEFKYMRTLDLNENVIEWSSEEIVVGYPCPFDKEKKKWRRYFPDFLVVMKEGAKVQIYMIEIKPGDQTKIPKKGEKSPKQLLNEQMTYALNQAKWEAATAYCKKKGWIFKILTEKELGIK